MSSKPALSIGVVGATGAVGTMMLRVLAERDVPIRNIRAFASERSAGTSVEFSGEAIPVETLDSADPSGLDYALFSAGAERALQHAPRFAAAGVVVVDNSSAFRADTSVPLVVPEVNPDEALRHSGIIANPNCSTIQLVVALKPILDAAGLDHVHITTFQSVSGTGAAAMDELHGQAQRVLEAEDVRPEIYPHPIAFNVVPHCGDFTADGSTVEERKFVDESRRILSLPNLAVSATCVRVPVFTGHSEAVHLQTSQPLSADEARGLLAASPGVRVVDDLAAASYPTPLQASGGDDVLVGRIRVDESRPNGLAMFVVADNLRKGAATNAVQLLELVSRAGVAPLAQARR
jgi:aspartate-semialdehyde dehydrogenase